VPVGGDEADGEVLLTREPARELVWPEAKPFGGETHHGASLFAQLPASVERLGDGPDADPRRLGHIVDRDRSSAVAAAMA
jgi:hypothetical protein